MLLYKSDIVHFDPSEVSLGDLQLFVYQLKMLEPAFGGELPDWFIEKRQEAELEMEKKMLGVKMLQLKNLRLARRSLRTTDEKRADVEAEIAKLEAELNKP